MKWVGPFTIDELLDKCFTGDSRPPIQKACYVVSKKKWQNQPDSNCMPLYVGSTTGNTKRFRTRIGDLIADIFGFFGGQTGHHSGGITLYNYCKQQQINPRTLYLGWVENVKCERCLEKDLYKSLDPKCNRSKPPRCKIHNKM